MFLMVTGPLLIICQWRGHQEKRTQPVGGGEREKWEIVFLSVWDLIFGIFRHTFLYISSTRQIFGHGNTKILFLTKLFFLFCLYFRQKGPSLGGGEEDNIVHWRGGTSPPQSMVLKEALQ
jgi:hypothetical protein